MSFHNHNIVEDVQIWAEDVVNMDAEKMVNVGRGEKDERE